MRRRGIRFFFASVASVVSAAIAGIFFLFQFTYASEVIEETHTRVIVREHPITKRPYVSVAAEDRLPDQSAKDGPQKKYKRPDYRLLDPKVKSGEISYEGPSSDRKKIYIFAASLAALGAAGGVTASAAIPASSAAAGASGGAGVYGAAGGAVAAGALSSGLASTRSNPEKDNFQQISKASLSQPIPIKRDK